ncbi:histidine kinase [Terrimonas sp. NA20]|uniref:Histidine kinase n=1 Tax=Terrimonas ginsenosidimutans TaxID=2908004 RepID=A0ABS9KZC9_9BACT|nr:histidine kinase [Terrimonas ginsenosidimutans]MCG2617737.1 histidine kinase [Terrimonas ginsenosidimutans]
MSTLQTKRFVKHRHIFIEVVCWLFAYVLFSFYLTQRLGNLAYAVSISTSAFLFFTAIVYTYSLWLYPRYYHKNRKLLFALIALLFLAVMSFPRLLTELVFFKTVFSGNTFFSAGRSHLSYIITTNSLALLIAILLKGAKEAALLRSKQAELENRQLLTELKLLKAQLHPHFLFNALNNIYYEVYKESPKGALLIEKLSDMMRFFLHITSKERIDLRHEVEFIRNYVMLEQIRFDDSLQISFTAEETASANIPPMLLVPLVENVFKHGIDKLEGSNQIELELKTDNGFIIFKTKNRLHLHNASNENSTGLDNLRERLNILFPTNYSLTTESINGYYYSVLKIPAA